MEAYTNEQLRKDIEELKEGNKIQKFESRVQTIAVVLIFFFGVATIHDIFKKK